MSYAAPDDFRTEDNETWQERENWQERFQASPEQLRQRAQTSDFCGALLALRYLLAEEYGTALEAESERMRARQDKPGETCEQILNKVLGAAMALMSAAIRADKERAAVRRFKIPSWQLEAYRRGTPFDFEGMDDATEKRIKNNLARYWREAWGVLFMFQRVSHLAFFERDARDFKDNTRAKEAAYYTDNLTDLISEIITRKRAMRGAVGRLEKFSRAARAALIEFRTRHPFAPEADGTEGEGAPEQKAEPRRRSKVLSFDKARRRILEGVEIARERAERGLLTPVQAAELLNDLAPLVEIAQAVRESAIRDGVPLADSDAEGPESAAEFVARASDGNCDFTAENEESAPRQADNFICQRNPPEVTLDEFLSAFFPNPYEDINLRAFGPKGEARFSARKWRTCREALACDPALVAQLHEANKTRGIYFVVNTGGDEAEDITRINGFFAESDEGTLAEQHARLDSCPVPPRVRVETLKSVHAHWPAARAVALEDFDEGQRRLINYFKSDAKIKDRSRVMRLPGFNYVAYNAGLLSYKPVAASHFDPSRRYTAAEMFAAFPAPAEAPKPQREFRSKTLRELTGDFEAYKRELGARIMAHPSARRNGKGKWDCRARCHEGRGVTGLFYDPADNFIHCNREPSCSLYTIARAFGLAPYSQVSNDTAA